MSATTLRNRVRVLAAIERIHRAIAVLEGLQHLVDLSQAVDVAPMLARLGKLEDELLRELAALSAAGVEVPRA